MKLLVTGGAGFIGSNFIHYWLQQHPDDHITNLDLLTYAGNLQNLTSLESNPNYTFIKGDIRDPKVVNQAMTDIDIIVHFAAETHVDNSIERPADFITTNVLGTQVLCQAALDAKVQRFHHISTDEVYGDLPLEPTSLKFTEDTSYNPSSPYSASKAGSDHIVRAYHRTFGLPITITNCANNFGPYHHPEKFIPRFITSLLQDQPVPVYGDGLNVRDWLYVDDHARAIDLVINQGRVGDTYLVGAQLDHEYSNLEITKLLIQLTGKDESLIEYVKDRPGHDRRYAINWSKLKTLGWKPEHDFKTRLAQTVDWYKQHTDWWQPLINSAHYQAYNQRTSQK